MSACVEDLNEDNEIEVSLSKKEDMITRLKEKGLLDYGAVINTDMYEFLLNRKRKDVDPGKWELLLLQLREVVKDNGFYITSRGRQGDLYILKPHEMPAYNDRKTKVVFRNLKQRQRALHMIDPSTVDSEYAKKLEFEILKNAKLEIEMAKLSKQRCK